jgi:hypothetical protein
MVVSATRGEAGQIRDASVATRATIASVRENELHAACALPDVATLQAVREDLSMNRRALVRRPSPRLAEGLLTHIERVPVDADLAVITRPGADERKPETSGTEQTLRELGYRIAHIEAPGTLDGGDVLKHDGTVWVGLGGRTNRAGVDQLAGHLEPLGAQVIGVPLTKLLHLKSAVTALPDGTVVGFEKLEGCVTCLSVRLRG